MGSREVLASASNLSAVCGTYFGSSSWQKSIVRPYAGRDMVQSIAVAFECALHARSEGI